MQYTKLTNAEWASIQAQAKTRFEKEVVGAKPTAKTVRKTLVNPHTINLLEWLALLSLAVIFVFTSFKMGTLAVPFADGSLEVLGQHTYIAPIIAIGFKVATATLFILLATPTLIYAKLLDASRTIQDDKRTTRNYPWYQKVSLAYLTPRLPFLVVYLSLAWLVYTSSLLPGSPFEQYLPVLVEITLATLVGDLLIKRAATDKLLRDALKEKTDKYESKVANYESDTGYLRLVYQIMRERLLNLERATSGYRKVKVNAPLLQAEEHVVNAVVLAEYRRLTGGHNFAKKALTPTESVEEADRIVPQAADGLRKPPAGQTAWTAESLLHDLQVRGIDPASGYGEAQISRDYAPDHKARAAWRAGARDAFLK